MGDFDVSCWIMDHNGKTVQPKLNLQCKLYTSIRHHFFRKIWSRPWDTHSCLIRNTPPKLRQLPSRPRSKFTVGISEWDVDKQFQIRVDYCIEEIRFSATWGIYKTNTKTGDQTKFTSKRLLKCHGCYRSMSHWWTIARDASYSPSLPINRLKSFCPRKYSEIRVDNPVTVNSGFTVRPRKCSDCELRITDPGSVLNYWFRTRT